MCANILRFNHTPVKTPINIHKEAPLMVVILIVRHCEEKSVAVLVVILMCDGFDQKSVALTLLMASSIGRPFRPPLRSEEQDGGPSASGGHLG